MSDMNTNLFETIDSLVSRRIDSTPIDLTITATIARLQNVTIGEYKVTYQGNTFSAYVMDPMITYAQGEEVYVLVPRGDFSSQKVILGKAAFNDKVSFADRQAMQNQWRTRGPNWLSPEMYWRDSTGSFNRAPIRNAGIVASHPDDDNDIDFPLANWRDYLFYRENSKELGANDIPVNSEPNYTAIRKSKTKFPNIDPTINGDRPDLTVKGLEHLQIVDGELQQWGGQMDYLMIMADFQTLFTDTHTTGDYGVMVECFVDNPRYGKTGFPDEQPYELLKFALSKADFNGAQYSFATPTPQRGVFPVPRGVIRGLSKVYLYQTEGWNTDIQPNTDGLKISFDPADGATKVLDKNNILAQDVQIYWCEPVNLSNKLFWLKVDAIKGTALFNTPTADSHITSIPLRARLMYGGQDVTDRETCKFIWYRQKYSAQRELSLTTPLDEKGQPVVDKFGNTWAGYIPEDEDGWAPVELLNNSINDDPYFGEDANYSFEDDTFHDVLNIRIEDVPWKWKYMVVCYYNPDGGNIESIQRNKFNDALIWEFETVRNLSSDYDFELPRPLMGEDPTHLFLRVRNNTLPWEEGILYDENDPSVPDPTKDWYCRWWWTSGKTYNDAASTDFPRFIKGRRRIDRLLLNEPIVVKAQIYGLKPSNGATQKERIENAAKWPIGANPPIADDVELQSGHWNQYEIANIERVIVSNNDSLVHVRFEPEAPIHQYNSDGSIGLNESANTQHTITAHITPIDDSVTVFSMEWLAPDGTPLGSLTPEEIVMGKGYNPPNSMLHSMWMSYPQSVNTSVTQQRVLHYKVAEKYEEDKSIARNNTPRLRLTFLNKVRQEESITIKYVTAGGNGAQGSEWVAQIAPTNPISTIDSDRTEVGFRPWSQRIQEHPRPLVVKGNWNSTDPILNANEDYSLFLRPFISRNGVPIERLPEATNYTYKVYWDVRFPNVKVPNSARAKAANYSFLGLRHARVSNRDIDDLGNSGAIKGGFVPPNKAGTQFLPTPNPLDLRLQAYTHSLDKEGIPYNGVPTDGQPTYSAIEVCWAGRGTVGAANDVTMEDMEWSFIVKAQIDIFYKDDKSGENKKVATIFSYHGTDVLFTGGTELQNTNPAAPGYFVPSKIRTNWPVDILYSSTGIAPEVPGRILHFNYGDRIYNTDVNPPISATPVNLTQAIQELSIDSEGFNVRDAWNSTAIYGREEREVIENPGTPNEIKRPGLTDVVTYEGHFYAVREIGSLPPNTPPDRSSLNDPNWRRISDLTNWKLRPRAFYFFEDVDNGALRTDIVTHTGKWPEGATINPDFEVWGNAVYVHPIVYRINHYGNDQINGWDGKSIDINGEDGTIFAPTIGAGWKHPFTNTFTGVIMGIDKSQLRNAYDDDYGGFAGDTVDQMKYMTGLYGYQDGASSFGIMENGTAFFGRADRGGRIIIDGFNAQIYGGISIEKKTGLDANMRNRMRLSFIDFGGAALDTDLLNDPAKVSEFLNRGAENPPTVNPPGQNPDPTEGLDVDGMPGINMGAFDVETEQEFVMYPTTRQWFGNFRHYFAPGIGMPGITGDPGEDPLAFYFGGFATGSGFSTPAIEIGSYEDWVRTPEGRRKEETRSEFQLMLDGNEDRYHPWRAGKQLIRQLSVSQVGELGRSDKTKLLEIPGFRRFLVTYDGTLYAMNAFIMGTIMGSNIIGSRFYTDTGDGVMTNYILAFGRNGPNTMTVMNDRGQWSPTPPTTITQPPSVVFSHLKQTHREFREGGSGDPNAPGNGFHFAVATDGTVIANRMNITGGSISIGTFHVIGKDNISPGWGELRPGDVFSFGTMHLIGRQSGSMPGLEDTAVNAWGAFYLRGKLTNLGPVYLGGTPEKTETGTLAATSFNSPLSVVPDTWWGDLNPRPKLPVKMGVWPLYFHIENGALTTQSNKAWVGFSSNPATTVFAEETNNGFMPAFSLREGADADSGPIIINEQSGYSKLSRHVVWRVDQLGQWSDGIFFTRTTWNNTLVKDDQPFKPENILTYFGWGEVPWHDGTVDVGVFMMKNVSKTAPNTLIEAPNATRISAGRYSDVRGKNPTTNFPETDAVIIDSYRRNTNDRKATLVASARHDTLTGSANMIVFAGLDDERTGPSNRDKSKIQCFVALNTLSWPTVTADNQLIHDERGQIVSIIPQNAREDTAGYIWIKSRTTILDAAHDMINVTSNLESSAQVRLNRTFDGSPTSITAPPTGDAIPADGSVLKGFVGIRADHAVNIVANNWFRINLGGVTVARSLAMTTTELRVTGYTAEQQFGIYARFA